LNKLLICIFFIAPLAQAQIASSSFFGETKSRNPGVIAKRVNGFTSVALLKDNIKKEQEFTAAQASTSADGTASSEIAINSNRFFRGGKGKGTTTELQVDIMKGTKSDEIIIAGTPSEVETTADLTLLNLGIGYGVFGIGFTKSAYDYTNSYSLNIDGTSISSDFKAKIDMTSFKFGYANNIGSFVYGAYGELAMNQIKSESPNPLEQLDESSGFMLIGFGAGIKTNGFHFEVGYEMPAQEQEQDPNLAEPITDKMLGPLLLQS
jgi:hypothetical protein